MEARKLSKSDSQPFQLYLRIRHPSMDPAALSRDFKIEAEHAYRAGDPRPKTRSGTTPRSVHSESYWQLWIHSSGRRIYPFLGIRSCNLLQSFWARQRPIPSAGLSRSAPPRFFICMRRCCAVSRLKAARSVFS
jgi:hypothetical protein